MLNPVRLAVFLIAFIGTAMAADSGGWTITPGFDCAKARSAVEKTICRKPQLAALDRSLSDMFRVRLAGLIDADRAKVLADQRSWLKLRDATCAGDDAAMAECLGVAYLRRMGELGESGPVWFAQRCDRTANRAVIAYPIGLAGVDALPLPNGTKIQCVFSNGTTLTAERAGAHLRVWIGHRIAFDREVASAIRLVVAGGVIEMCDGVLSTDRADKDGLRCVPIAQTFSAGPMDYVTFPPSGAARPSDEIMILYGEDQAFCRRFIGKSDVVLAPSLGAIPVESEEYPPLVPWGGRALWAEVRLFSENNVDYVFSRSAPGQLPVYAEIQRRDSNKRHVICRFTSFGAMP